MSCFILGLLVMGVVADPTKGSIVLQTSAVVGHDIVLSCFTDAVSGVNWIYHHQTEIITKFITKGREVLINNHKYELSNSSEHEFNLKVLRVKPTDEGIYTCNEINGERDVLSYSLRVTAEVTTKRSMSESTEFGNTEMRKETSDWLFSAVCVILICVVINTLILSAHVIEARCSKHQHGKEKVAEKPVQVGQQLLMKAP